MYPSIGEQAHAKLKIAFYSKTSQTPIHLTHYNLESLENSSGLRAIGEQESSYQTSSSRVAEEFNAQIFCYQTPRDLEGWILAGAPGFEPGNGGTKNRCLTTWRRPNLRD